MEGNAEAFGSNRQFRKNYTGTFILGDIVRKEPDSVIHQVLALHRPGNENTYYTK